jgi:hypothetical protein
LLKNPVIEQILLINAASATLCLFTDIFSVLLEKGHKHPYTWHSLRESANNFSLAMSISFLT